jgi:ribosomal protein S27E
MVQRKIHINYPDRLETKEMEVESKEIDISPKKCHHCNKSSKAEKMRFDDEFTIVRCKGCGNFIEGEHKPCKSKLIWWDTHIKGFPTSGMSGVRCSKCRAEITLLIS